METLKELWKSTKTVAKEAFFNEGKICQRENNDKDSFDVVLVG